MTRFNCDVESTDNLIQPIQNTHRHFRHVSFTRFHKNQHQVISNRSDVADIAPKTSTVRAELADPAGPETMATACGLKRQSDKQKFH